MLTTYFKSPHSMDKYRSGLAGPHLDDFIAWLEGLGYRWNSVRRCIQAIAVFSDWAITEGLTVHMLDRGALDKLRRYLADRKILHYPNGSHNHVYRSARVFVSYLEDAGVVALCDPQPTAEDPVLLQEFAQWMQLHRGTKDSTLACYRRSIIALLQRLGNEPNTYTAKGLREFLRAQMEGSSQEKSKILATAIRMFLRFLIARCNCATGFEQAVPSVARWRLSSRPKYISDKDVESLIDSCNQASPLGARDRSILLLLARLGLRAGEVSALKIADLNWTEGTLIISGKNRRETRLPLTQEVGDAILHYLKHGRPHVESDHVFITNIAPFTAITRFAVSGTVDRALHQTGINSPSRGAHLLRHSVATSLLRQGVSLPAIGALLRHASIETTTVYAKVDFALLKEVAMSWPEVPSC